MDNDARRREGPHLPGLGRRAVEPWPSRLVESDDRVRKHVGEQRRVDALQPTRERVGQIPEVWEVMTRPFRSMIRTCRSSGMWSRYLSRTTIIASASE
jgi:hypothetical protein